MLSFSATARTRSVRAQLFTTPHDGTSDPLTALCSLVDQARHTLHFAVYSFTSIRIANALKDAHQRGVAVRGVVDAQQGAGQFSQVANLKAWGVDVREWGKPRHLMHSKVLLADVHNPRLAKMALGSYNWTSGAEFTNKETMVVLSGGTVAATLGPAALQQIDDAYGEGF